MHNLQQSGLEEELIIYSSCGIIREGKKQVGSGHFLWNRKRGYIGNQGEDMRMRKVRKAKTTHHPYNITKRSPIENLYQKVDKEVNKSKDRFSLKQLLIFYFYKHLLIDITKISDRKMQRAHSFEQHVSFVKNLMGREEYKDKSNKEIDNILIQRIKKYYVTTDSIQVDVQHFRPRLEPLYTKGVEPSNDTLVLFGIDFMKRQQLKEYFNISNSNFAIIDQSNCIITFPNALTAVEAIRTNADQQSLTYVKIEEDEDSEPWEKEENRRKWIELRPYTFIYKRSRFTSKEYKRKLYVRYATTREKQAGFDKLSLVESMISRCKLIWEKQASNENTKAFLERKLISLNETKRTMQNQQQIGNSQRVERNARSRSRDKKSNSSRMQVQKPERSQSNRQNEILQGLDDDLGSQIRSRASNSDMSQLINQFQNLQVEIDEHQKSLIANMSMFKTKDKTQHSIDPDITYNLIQPAQLRVNFKNEKFSYKAYVKESIEREENKKVVSFFDLTLE